MKTKLSNLEPNVATPMIGGVIASVLASSVVDREFEHLRVKPKTIKLVSVASPLSTQH